MKYNDRYRIESTRYSQWAYNRGEYFITICTKERRCYLGDIQLDDNQDFVMYLSDIGRYVDEVVRRVSDHFPYVTIPCYVIMPNHIHLIVVVGEDNSSKTVRQYVGVETRHAASCNPNDDNTCPTNAASLPDRMRNLALNKGKLPTVIGNMKSAVTKYANEHGIAFGWQSLFYDQIIYKQEDRREFVKYIENNVRNWGMDELNDDRKL